MGYIYKITNQVNGKVYIGQTVATLKRRFMQHRNNANKPYFAQVVLYKAFNKYGVENFTFEEVEEIPNDQLDEREKYWIKYFDSYNNGYNSTIGGRTVQLYDWDIDEIISLYHQLKSARKVAKELGCDHSTIDHILNANGVERYTAAQQLSKPIYLTKDGEELRFETVVEAAEWLIANKKVRSNNVRCVRQYLTNNYLKGKQYYGYDISYESKR